MKSSMGKKLLLRMAGSNGALTIQPIKTVIKNKCHLRVITQALIRTPQNKKTPKEGSDKYLFLLKNKKYYISKLT